MSSLPTDRKYSKTHEWFRVEADGLVRVGITQFAADELTDITFVALPAVGKVVSAGSAFGGGRDPILKQRRERHVVELCDCVRLSG